MDVAVTWICLGGGVVLIVVSIVVIMRLQDRTREQEPAASQLEHDDN